MADGVRGGDEGERGNQHLVVADDAAQLERDLQRGGAIAYDHRMSGAGVGRQIPFETVDVRADRGDPTGLDAVRHVGQFLAAEGWLMQGGALPPGNLLQAFGNGRGNRRHGDASPQML